MRNPLSSIVLNTELLEEELGSCASPNGGEMRSLVTSIKGEAARLHTLTDVTAGVKGIAVVGQVLHNGHIFSQDHGRLKLPVVRDHRNLRTGSA